MNRASTVQSRIRVITPYLHHDGSSLLLYRFLRWLTSARSHIRFDILYIYDGPVRAMIERLSNVDSVVHLCPARRRFRHRIDEQLHRKRLRNLLGGADAIYCNTVVALQWLDAFVQSGAIAPSALPKVTVHLRELGFWLTKAGLTREAFARLPVHIIADSRLTGENLATTLGITNYVVIDEYCDIDEVQRWKGADRIRSELGLPDERRIVGMAGTIEWRKGPDLFLLVARGLADMMTNPPMMVWVGGFSDAITEYQLTSERRRLGLEKMVVFLGAKENPYPYYDSLDLFLLSSREEPFGAVALEAAALGIPTLCFQGCAGAETFIKGGCGVVVELFDTKAMAQSVRELLIDGERRRRLGGKAAEVCREEHHFDVLLPRLIEEILSISR
jgi:glycosyltransferase involved in cell wall biosynthesis